MLNYLKENEMVLSATDTIKERLGSSMYGSFAISWIIINWKFVLTAFFTGSDTILESTKMVKIDYLSSLYDWSTFPGWSLGLLKLIIFPIISVYLIIFQLSKIDKCVHKKHCSNVIEKNLELMRQKAELLKQETTILKKQKSQLEKKVKAVKEKEEVEKDLSKEDKWDLEYEELKNIANFRPAMEALEKCLYSDDGSTQYTPTKHRAFFDVNGITNPHSKHSNHVIASDKGKYFLKKYIRNKE